MPLAPSTVLKPGRYQQTVYWMNGFSYSGISMSSLIESVSKKLLAKHVFMILIVMNLINAVHLKHLQEKPRRILSTGYQPVTIQTEFKKSIKILFVHVKCYVESLYVKQLECNWTDCNEDVKPGTSITLFLLLCKLAFGYSTTNWRNTVWIEDCLGLVILLSNILAYNCQILH